MQFTLLLRCSLLIIIQCKIQLNTTKLDKLIVGFKREPLRKKIGILESLLLWVQQVSLTLFVFFLRNPVHGHQVAYATMRLISEDNIFCKHTYGNKERKKKTKLEPSTVWMECYFNLIGDKILIITKFIFPAGKFRRVYT